MPRLATSVQRRGIKPLPPCSLYDVAALEPKAKAWPAPETTLSLRSNAATDEMLPNLMPSA
jgi:hypothetical protein